MSKSLRYLVLCLFCTYFADASELAYVSSPDGGVVYRIDLNRSVVQKTYHVGGHPQYISLLGNKLFIEGEVGQDGWGYVDVFDLENEKCVERIRTGVVSAGPVVNGNELIYGIQSPRPEILFLNFTSFGTTSLPLPDGLIPGSVALTPDMTHLFVVATEYQGSGVPLRTVLVDVLLKDRQMKIKEELPKGADSIIFLEDRLLMHISSNTVKDQFILRSYPDMETLRELEVPYFCEDYTNRHKYATVRKPPQFVVAGGSCAGDELLEQNEPTLVTINSNGQVIWKVTSAGDGIPDPFSVAVLADGRIVFVASDFGLGILDPTTGRLLRRIKIDDANALWGLAVDIPAPHGP